MRDGGGVGRNCHQSNNPQPCTVEKLNNESNESLNGRDLPRWKVSTRAVGDSEAVQYNKIHINCDVFETVGKTSITIHS